MYEHQELEDHDRGLAFDLQTMKRRNLLGFLVKAGMTVGLVGCGAQIAGDSSLAGSTDALSGNASSASTGSNAAAGSCSVIPEETAGPYQVMGPMDPTR